MNIDIIKDYILLIQNSLDSKFQYNISKLDKSINYNKFLESLNKRKY